MMFSSPIFIYCYIMLCYIFWPILSVTPKLWFHLLITYMLFFKTIIDWAYNFPPCLCHFPLLKFIWKVSCNNFISFLLNETLTPCLFFAFQVLVIFSCGLFYALQCYVQITSTPRQAARPPWSAASSG